MKTRAKKIKNIVLGVLTALAAAAMALLPVLLRSSQTGEPDAASILSATVERGGIRTTISGGGALAGADARKISLPHGVELTRYLVKNGQSVTAGQPLAEVDKVTVMQTIATVQKNLEYLDSRMSEVRAPRTKDTLSSPVPGRVKAVYAQVGDAVAEVMAEHGALLVISLDGRMAVEVETQEAVAVGESLAVTLSDGKTVAGRVERRQEDTLTVTLTDDGPALGERVRLQTEDGRDLGEGELYVHAAWNLTAASGVVKDLYVRTGDKVQRGYGLCFLEEMDGSGRYDQLAAQRRDYEDALRELFALYETGAVNAEEDGIVAGIDEARVGLLRAGAGEYTLMLLDDGDPAIPDPNTTPPAAMQNKAAVVSDVTFGSVTFLTNADYISISSYAAATEPDYTHPVPVTQYSFGANMLYAFNIETGAWEAWNPMNLRTGQLVYLVYEGDALKWVLYPVQPEPEVPEEGDLDIGGGGGGAAPFEMYELTRTEVMRLSPLGDMTVKVKIDEMDILYVAPGQEAEITVDALPGRSFVGHVREIDPNGVNSGGRTRYTVTITVDREAELLSGMNATAILTVGVTEDILVLPVAALAEKGSRTLVYTAVDPQSGELLLPAEVETGISDGMYVEIVSGLMEGQPVFYSYYETDAMPELSALPGQMT